MEKEGGAGNLRIKDKSRKLFVNIFIIDMEAFHYRHNFNQRVQIAYGNRGAGPLKKGPERGQRVAH